MHYDYLIVGSGLFGATFARYAADSGKTLYGLLMDIYAKYGYYREKMLSFTMKGKTGLERIASLMAGLVIILSYLFKKPLDKIAFFPFLSIKGKNFARRHRLINRGTNSNLYMQAKSCTIKKRQYPKGRCLCFIA